MSIINIGTRGSPLALAQAHEVRARLMKAHELPVDQFEIKVLSTAGDRIQDKALSEFGGKGLFTKEIESALLAQQIDLAVHSMKDVQTQLPDGLIITAMLPREDVRDGFISRLYGDIDELPEGAVVGTSSLRRQAQLKEKRPDLEVITFRGSVQTRLDKLARGEVSATFLAVAGLNRLQMKAHLTKAIDTNVMLPAVAQGAIGIECRIGDERIEQLLAPLNDEVTSLCVTAERAFLRRLDGSCRTPIAALAELIGAGTSGGMTEGVEENAGSLQIKFRGQILAPDGSSSFYEETSGLASEAQKIAVEVAERLIERAGPDFLAALV